MSKPKTTPKGWKLVPIEPTADMINAATEYADGYNRAYYNGLYKAMIASAPEASCLNQ